MQTFASLLPYLLVLLNNFLHSEERRGEGETTSEGGVCLYTEKISPIPAVTI